MVYKLLTYQICQRRIFLSFS